METAFVVHGILKNQKYIELNEQLPFKNGEILVTVQPSETRLPKKREAGLWKGKIKIAPDFDAAMDDFQDYM